MAETYLALLRGINVGGNNLLPMRDLREMFARAGCRDVRTYIQSGNVIFVADPDLVPALPDLITAQIAVRFGYRVPLVLRTTAQVAAVAAHNPFIEAGVAEGRLYVLFLADPPSDAQIGALDPDRSPPDAFAVRGQEVYLWLADGSARTKLTNGYFDAKLATVSTNRNWQTVNKLLALMEG